MINEMFLNTCFTLALAESEKIKDKTLFRDMIDIVTFFKKKETVDIPLIFKNKVECLETICEMRINDKNINNIADSLMSGKKYLNLKDFIYEKMSEKVLEKDILDHIKQLKLKKKLVCLFENGYDDLNKFLTSFAGGTYSTIDDLIMDYEFTIKKLYVDMMTENKYLLTESSCSIDTQDVGFSSFMQNILMKYMRTQTTPTGYDVFDNKVLNGGFQKTRLYVLAGGSGSGKSTLLINLMTESATSDWHKFIINEKSLQKDDSKKVYIYITLENMLEESILRTYQAMFEKTEPEALADIRKGIDLVVKIKEKFEKNNSIFVMKYFAPQSISPNDISMIIDEEVTKHGKDSIKGIYIDYLDLLRTDIRYDLTRLELGHITVSLKTIAVEYNIPVITATQLNRSVYRILDAYELNNSLVGESIDKVHHADFVLLMAADPNDEKKILGRIGKNRNGPSGAAIEFKVDLKMFKFYSGQLQDRNTDKKTNKLNQGMKESDVSFDFNTFVVT